ncbi:hypothetical protein GCM10010240_47470 [Streptomyces griseoviridis]|nr:hypothetical protein GCM10010240_47470 [Streptomyces griseoviridis]
MNCMGLSFFHGALPDPAQLNGAIVSIGAFAPDARPCRRDFHDRKDEDPWRTSDPPLTRNFSI